MSTSRLAQLAALCAVVALALVVGAPLAVQLGALGGFVAFRLYLLGTAVGALALLLGLVGLYATRPATGRAGRRRALGATLVGAGLVATMLGLAAPSSDLPVINDVTTDPADPPAFRALADEPANAGRDMGYPADFAEKQAAGYPDLAPIALEGSPREAHTLVTEAMRRLGWSIERSDPERGEIEATVTSRVFRFVDDVAVRIRPDGAGSRVDVRSKSRDGRGDLGANAARIRALHDALRRV